MEELIKKLIKEQQKTNELLTVLVGIFLDEEDPDETPPAYLSGMPRENLKAKDPNPQG